MILFDPQSLEGKQIDQFRLDQYIARGAMGLVYKAHDTILQRTVAIKLIPKTDDPDAVKDDAGRRLIREAQAAGRLSHPGIVTVFAYGETPQFRYICMEYVPGRTLAEYLRERKQLDVDQVTNITIQILLALDAANREGIVHRDIKPSNVMLTEGAKVKVMDFGIAKLPSLGMTATGTVLGTPYYMSPEQIMGQKVDIRSDLFATGAVMYQLLTGERPFEAESSSALIYKILHAEPVPAHDVSARIPGPLSEIVKKALAKNPAHRYQTPMEMLNALKEAAQAPAPPAEDDYAATIVAERPPLEAARPTAVEQTDSVSRAPRPNQEKKRPEPVAKEAPVRDRTSGEAAQAAPFSLFPTGAPPDRTPPPAAPGTLRSAQPSGQDHGVDAPPHTSRTPKAAKQPSPPIPEAPSEPEDEFADDEPESFVSKQTRSHSAAPSPGKRPSGAAFALLAAALGTGLILYYVLSGPKQPPQHKPTGSQGQQPAQSGAAKVDPAPPPTVHSPQPVDTARSTGQQPSPAVPDARGLMHSPKEPNFYQDQGRQGQGAMPTESFAPERVQPSGAPPLEERSKAQQTASTMPEPPGTIPTPKEPGTRPEKSTPEFKPAQPPPAEVDASPKDAQNRVQLLLSQAETSYRKGLIISPEGVSSVSYYREAFAIDERSPLVYESVFKLVEDSLAGAKDAVRNKQSSSAKAHIDKAEKILQAVPQPPLAQYQSVLARMRQDIAGISKAVSETSRVKPPRVPTPTGPPAKPVAKPSTKPGQPGIMTEDFNTGQATSTTSRPTTKPRSPTTQPGILNESFR